MKITMKRLAVTILASTMVLTPLSQVAAQSTYTVQPGEWLLKIANDHGVSVNDLKAWNGLTSDWIDVGQVLQIGPSETTVTNDNGATEAGTGGQTGTYVVQPGDTLYTIALANGLSVDALMANNGLTSSWINVGDRLSLTAGGTNAGQVTNPVAPSSNGYHIVQPGDTLSYIAVANGTTVENIMALNGLSSTWLTVGVKLLVTGTASTPSQTYTQATSYTGDWGNYHTVQAGDTLWDIANAYGTTYASIMAANGLASSYLNVGDQLLVPGYIETVVAEGNTNQAVADNQEETTEADKAKDDKKEADKDSKDSKDLRELTKEELEKLYQELPEAAWPRKHKIAEGDSLDSIAKAYNFSVNSLIEWNDLQEGEVLEIDQEIYVSNPRYIPEIYEVAAGDSIDSIAKMFEISAEELDEWNKLEGGAVIAGDKLVVSDPTPRQHKVQPREKLEDIAKKYGITKDQLVEWNNLPATVQFFNGTLAVVDPEGVEFAKNENPAEEIQEEASQE